MFGYVRPYTPELKIRENELYKAVYCGLCKTMGRHTGSLSRITLSYDATFFALVLASLNGEKFKVKKEKCGLNPFKKKLAAQENETLKFCAASSAHLTYYSLLDKIADSRGIKKLFYKTLLPKAKKIKEKGKKIYPFDDKTAESILEKLSENERTKNPSLDSGADIFGELLAYYFRSGSPDGKKNSAEIIGRNTGRFVYACDALDDIEKDRKKGNYNPFLYMKTDEKTMHAVFGAMCIWADTAAGELELEGECGDALDIAENIMRLGMVDTAKKLTGKAGRKEKKGADGNGKRPV